MIRIVAWSLAIAATVLAAPLHAAELKVVSAGAVRGLIAGMINDYSRQTGHKFDFTVGTTGQLRVIIESGWPADLIIVSGPLMAELEKTGNLTPGSRADLGRMGIGVVVREGAAAPDVSTPEAFKAALVAAKSVAYTDPTAGGTSGVYLVGVLERLGIGDIVKPKAVLTAGGKETSEAVVHGEAEIGVTLISEIIAVKGTKFVGPLPGPLQNFTVYAAAIPKASTDPTNARAFVNSLTSPAMAPRWKAAGFEPPK
jgi:molybdate transport system substrate-binding protein